METTHVLKDPVCGMAVTEHSFHHHEHLGRVHYFCGAGCKARFATHAMRYTQTGAVPKWKGLIGWLLSL